MPAVHASLRGAAGWRGNRGVGAR